MNPSQTFPPHFDRATPAELAALASEWNEALAPLDAEARMLKAFSFFGPSLIATSSFGRDAALLLHHLYRLSITARVYFIDTGFHFPETLAYRDTLANAWKLDVRSMASEAQDRRRYAVEADRQLRITDTDACCAMNKVAVQRAFLALPDVTAFMTGLRRDQSPTRKDTPFASVQRGRIKLCPFADWKQEEVDLYLRLWELPEHPLAAQGYTSIGCSPVTCTRPPISGEDGRSGRWAGEAKTECGLHLDNEP